MASTEVGEPADKFAAEFARAKELGLERVAHAGEEGPAENIWTSIRALQVSRIDHGVHCDQDEALMDELVATKMPLTICPLSNVMLKVFDKLEDHNLKKLLRRGIRVTINSDDPAYFGGYLLDNYTAVYEKLELSVDDMVTLAKNSFLASFLPRDKVDQFLAEIDQLYIEFKQKQKYNQLI